MIAGITGVDGGPPSCIATAPQDRLACISNMDALSEGGEAQCLDLGCCFAPDYSDLSTPACFQDISYGKFT